MRCSLKLTTWSASAGLLALMVSATVAAAIPFETETVERVRGAIAVAVRQRMGDSANVTIDVQSIDGSIGTGPLLATPEPGARTGRVIVFSLSGQMDGKTLRRMGSTTARLSVVAPHAVALRALSRGTILAAGDIAEDASPLVDVPLRALALPGVLAGGRLTRDVAAGAVLSSDVIQPVPLVRSGDLVVVRARVGGIEAEGRAIASQNGVAGDVIRLVNPDSRRTLQGRIVGAGEVEVIHES
jgi:flagella basal body P-ring formation protein FlgA